MVRRLALIAGFLACLPVSAGAFPRPAVLEPQAAVPREVIVRFRAGTSEWQREAIRQRMNGRVKHQFRRADVQLIELETGSAEQVVLQLGDDPLIQYIEPNYRWQILATPTDPRFPEQWSLRNVGQTGGFTGADIRATAAWDAFTGDPNLRIGVIDTGVDYNHPDLAENVWTNPGEIPANLIDDDGNGYVDDVHGWDTVNSDGDPMDDHGHGTHVSGIIAAVANNGVGIAGVNWRAKIVAIKFLDGGGGGSTSRAIESIEYALAIGLKITNNSWGGGSFSEALLDAINQAGAAGQIFVAAAGNDGTNNDQNPHYPATYPSGNIISVAATDGRDQLAEFSNFGATTVDLAAPGALILSTVPSGGYLASSGTSMACPHVAGTLALLWGHRPEMSAAQARARLLAGVDPRPDLIGRVATGGRLNALFAVSDEDSVPPGAITNLAVRSVASNSVVLTWTATGDDGADGRAFSYDVRFSTAPITVANFGSATPFPGPDPRHSGVVDSVEVRGLPFHSTHYFALRALDEFSNPGPVSNVVSATTLGVPQVAVSPASVSATLEGGSEHRTLTIANQGEGTLDFSIPPPNIAAPAMAQKPTVVVAKGALDPRRGAPVVADQGGPDSFGYRWIDSDDPGGPVFDWMDPGLDATLTELSGDEEVLTGIPIGFPFPFYGSEFESLNLCVNGWLSFTDARAPSFNIQPLPNNSSHSPANLVAPFWSDLLTGSARRIYYHSDGERFVASWVGLSNYLLGGTFTFQVHLLRSGEMLFQYHTMSGPDSLSSIGIQNRERNVGLNVSFLADYARPGLAVRIVAPASWLSANPPSGRIPAGSSQAVDLTLDATRLLGGTYRSELHVLSNDPDESDRIVPVQLVAIGIPEIELSQTVIDFGLVLTGGTVRETLFVQNPGTDTLRVTRVAVEPAAFVAEPAALVVPPLSQRRVIVEFTPTANGPWVGTLTLNSNDADEAVRTVALSGNGLPPPDIAVAPESLWVGLDVGGAKSRTLRVANPGESDLHVIARPFSIAGAGPDPPAGAAARLPFDPPAHAPRPTPPGPEANQTVRSLPPVGLAGVYSGSRMAFGVTDFGEVMPFQFAPGSDHLGGGTSISGYTVGFRTAGSETPSVHTAGYDHRAGIVPESFHEVESSASRVQVRVTARTADGALRIVRDILFHRDDQFVHVTTRLENLTPVPLDGVVLKEFADWDVDGDPADDTWDFDRTRNLIFASDASFTGLAAGTAPQVLDLYGWEDFPSYTTVSNFVTGPIHQLDGLALIHFDLGDLGVDAVAIATTTYGAGASLADLQAAVDRSLAGAAWLTAEPDTFTVPAGAFVDVSVGFDADILLGGDHRAILRLTSNDPNQGRLDVPVLLHVVGVPDVILQPAALVFDTTFVGHAGVETLLVRNPGTDSLRVADISSPDPSYSADPAAFTVGPLEVRSVVVTFVPTGVGASGAFIVLSSNDPDQPQLEIPTHAVGILPPNAGAAPDSFHVGLFSASTHHRSLLLGNTGASHLRASIEPVSTDGTQGTRSIEVLGAPAPADPHAGIRLDDWQTRGRSRRLATPSDTTPPRRPSLPVVIHDPAGDAAGSDLERLRGAGMQGELRIAVELAAPLNPSNFGGYLSLDTDRNPATGIPPVFGAPGQDIGQDFVVALFPVVTGVVDLYRSDGAYLGPFPVERGTSGFAFAIPLSVLGDEGNVDVSGVVGTGAGPTDWFPDTGHGTISSAPWLAIAPAEVTVLPGATVGLDIAFDASGLDAGDYTANIVIRTNDPGEGSTLIVPARLSVTGAPEIAVSRDRLEFGDLFLGFSTVESLVVRNDGTDGLAITEVTSSDPAFVVTGSSLSLAPGASVPFTVRFTPSAAIDYAAVIEVRSNDLDEPITRIPVDGRGLVPPVLGAAPESLFIGLRSNETHARTVRVSNTGGSDLRVSITAGLSLVGSPAGPDVERIEAAGFDPRRRHGPGGATDPAENRTRAAAKPEINSAPRSAPQGVLAGSYSGAQIAFGITDHGEIMPYQFPIGNEHLARGGFVSGYTVGYVIDGFERVFWSGHDTRFGIVPVSYQELIHTPGLVAVRVTTATSDGAFRIIRDFEFHRSESFIRVTTRLENLVASPVPGVVFKEFTDWDMDGDFTDDSWNYDHGRALTYGWDQKYAGLAGSRMPDKMDLFGWRDHDNYDTYIDFPVGPINNFDGTPLLHFDHGVMPVGGSVTAGVVYASAHSLAELQATVDRANTMWLTVGPTPITVPPGGHADLDIQLDVTGVRGGLYPAEIRLESNDPLNDRSVVPLLLQVTGVADIRATPAALDFGAVFVGNSAADTVEVRNAGTDHLVVTGITFSDPTFSTGDQTFTVEPGASRHVFIDFRPGTPTGFSGSATFHSNDPDQPVMDIALSGIGLEPPEIDVAPESLNVMVVLGQSTQRTLTIGNLGASDLTASLTIADQLTGPAGPIRTFPIGASTPGPTEGPGPGANARASSGTPRALAGTYVGSKMLFGLTELGEIMPGQFPVGVEHLMISAQVSGYTVGYLSGTTPIVHVAGHDLRRGIEPESYQELAVTSSAVLVRTTARTTDGFLRIIRDITFRRSDQFIHVATTIENLTDAPMSGVIFKEYADYDVDGDAGGDRWTREFNQNLAYAFDARYVGLAGKDPPTLLDMYGWVDYFSYNTVAQNFSVNPTPIDGMALLHYALGTVPGRAKVTRSVAYVIAASRPNLFAAVARAGASPPWIAADQTGVVLEPGQSQELILTLDSRDMAAGEHRAVARIQSNDPDEPSIEIPIRMTVMIVPDIAAEPFDFGPVYLGQDRVQPVVLHNQGPVPLEISETTTTGSFAVVGPTSASIPAGDSLGVSVRFTPTSACAPCAGTLIVSSNDPDENPFSVSLVGAGVVPPRGTVGPAALQAALATGLGPAASATTKTLAIANTGGSALSGRAVPVEVAAAGARAFAFASLSASRGAPEPPAATGGGPDAGGYTWMASDEAGGPVFDWVDIAQLGNRLSLTGNDNVLPDVPIGFPFPFYGETFSTVNLSTNGWLSFTSTLVPGSTPSALPSTDSTTPLNLVAPFWGNLTFGNLQRAYAVADSGRFVVSYVGVLTLPMTGNCTFQTILYPDGRIRFQYATIPVPSPSGGTIGIQNGDGTIGLTVSHGAPFLESNFAIEFAPGIDWIRVVPGVFEVQAGGTMPIGVSFDASRLSDGEHRAAIRIMTNDPTTPVIDVPVSLHVGSIAAGFKIDLRCPRNGDRGHVVFGGDDDDDGGGGGRDDDDDDGGGGGRDDDDDDSGGGRHDDDDDDGGKHDDDDDDGGRDDDHVRDRHVRGVITLPAGYDPHDVVISSIRAAGTVPVTTNKRPSIQRQQLKVWFDRAALLAALPVGDSVSVSVVGEVDGVTWFGGSAPACVDRPAAAALDPAAPIDLPAARAGPEIFGLRLAGPNPSRGGPTLELALPARQSFQLDVYDVRGARVRSYPAAELDAGWHRMSWDGRGDDGRPLGAGVYFVRGTTGREHVTVRVAVLK